MLSPVLEALTFRSNNAVHRPVIAAIGFLKEHSDDSKRYFALDEGVPIEGVVKNNSRDIVIEKDANGAEKINRINYEICLLEALPRGLHRLSG